MNLINFIEAHRLDELQMHGKDPPRCRQLSQPLNLSEFLPLSLFFVGRQPNSSRAQPCSWRNWFWSFLAACNNYWNLGVNYRKITCIRLHSIDEGRPKPSVVALFTLIFLLPIHYPLPSFPLVCRNSNWNVFSGRPVHLPIRCIYALKI